MKVYLNSSPVDGPWGGGNQWVKAFNVHPGAESGFELNAAGHADVIMIVSLDGDGRHPPAESLAWSKKASQKLIVRVNENDARKGTNHVDNRLLALSTQVDATVFVSHWLMEYFLKRGWKCANNVVIHNGVDSKVFVRHAPNSKLTNVPFAHKHHGRTNIVAHHWSDNPLKGADIYEALDGFVGKNPDYTFTYIGRTKSRLVNTYMVPPSPANELGKWLGRFDVYVSGSRWDPGPNHVSESISCGLPTYVHGEGGGCVEFAGADHAYADWAELEQVLLGRTFVPNATTFDDWGKCIQRYVDFINGVSLR